MRFANIQILRVIAASGVVLYHLGCHSPALIGVDPVGLRHDMIAGFPVPLFFAVSGFVLAHAVQTASPGRFLLARFLRLYPGYWLALGGVVLVMRLRLFTEHDRWLIYFVNATELFLWPTGPDRCPYLLGIEWSLIYEVFLSIALLGLSRFGPRRGLPVAAGVWLGLLVGKMVIRPGYAFDMIPHWSTITLSPYCTPFLLGVLAYAVRDRGKRWRWAVLPGVVGLLVVAPARLPDPEWHWLNWGLAAAGVVWLAVQFPQVSERNPLARLGDCTYGLFLFHVPLLFTVLHAAARTGWKGHVEVVWAAAAVALVGGFLFGRLESAVHARLRPLTKVGTEDLRLWPGRVLARLRQTTRL